MQEVPQDEEVHGEAGELQLRRRPRDQRQLKSAKLRKSTPPPSWDLPHPIYIYV